MLGRHGERPPRQPPGGAVKVGGAGSRLGALSVLAVATATIYLAPRLFPAAAIRHAALAFGLGLASANWAGFAATAVITLAGILWRIHAEEHALMATLGAPYQAYAARHKRLVPLVW